MATNVVLPRLTAGERVQNGARWLDENFPGWESRVDPETLDLWSGERCICGQVFAHEPGVAQQELQEGDSDGFRFARNNLFSEANSWITALVGVEPLPNPHPCDEWRYTEVSRDRADAVAVVLGFMGDNGDDLGFMGDNGYDEEPAPDDWDNLQDAWMDLLRERATDAGESMMMTLAIRVGGEWHSVQDEMTDEQLPEVTLSEQCDNCGGSEPFRARWEYSVPMTTMTTSYFCSVCGERLRGANG